ncbi:MAG: hypothetical protein QW791_07210 [Candidatus Bathyarchaeia archaeon]
MKTKLTFLSMSALVSGIYADDTLLNQFLGSPLLALAAIIVIVVIAFLYRKVRK